MSAASLPVLPPSMLGILGGGQLGRMFTVARKLAAEAGIAEDGYRLIMNCNRHGGQEVYHIHLHLVGGEPLGPLLSL